MTSKNAADSKAGSTNDIVDHALTLGVDRKNELMVYILPDDVYSGMYTNNLIHGIVYSSKEEQRNGNPDCEFWIPIHMQLNTYGLASLNAWDGNHIEINENEEYILAPQIGAGEKDNENKFTGIVMGKVETYDQTLQKDWSTGLLGYAHGVQSIFLDAKTGNATFGLNSNFKEYDDKNGHAQYDARIELRPRGVSSISKWHFDDSSLYSANFDGIDLRLKNAETDEEKNDGHYYVGNSKYKDAPEGAPHSIPHWAQGIMLDSKPAYISVKGKRLTDDKIDFNSANAVVTPGDTFEVQLDPNDESLFTIYRHTNTVEDKNFTVYTEDNGKKIVINRKDPNIVYTEAVYNGNVYTDNLIVGWKVILPVSERSSDFIIPEFSNNTWYLKQTSTVKKQIIKAGDIITTDINADEGNWRREAKVGIDAQGRFYTNALRESSTALTIGSIGAFGRPARDDAYIGSQFEVGEEGRSNKNLIRFFVDADEINDGKSHLYMSAASDINNTEYERPFSMHFKEIDLYSDNLNNKNPSSKYNIKLNSKQVLLQHNETYLDLQTHTTSDSTSTLYTSNNYAEKVNNTKNITISGTRILNTQNALVETVSKGNVLKTWGNSATINIADNLNLKTGTTTTGLKLITNNSSINDNRYVYLGSQADTIPNYPNTISSTSINSETSFRVTMSKECMLKLYSGAVKSHLLAPGGIDIATNTGPLRLLTWGSSEGIEMLTNPSTGAPSTGIRFRMVPQSGGGGFFSLQAPDVATWKEDPNKAKTFGINLNSNGELTAPNYYGNDQTWGCISATPGINTNFLHINGKASQSYPKYGITSDRPIQINGGKDTNSFFEGNVYAREYYWNSAGVGSYNVGSGNQTYGSNKIWDHLLKIYSLLTALKDWTDKTFVAKGGYTGTGQELSNRITTAQNTADAAQRAANTAQSAADNKVDKSTYNNHKHATTNRLLTVPSEWTQNITVVDIASAPHIVSHIDEYTDLQYWDTGGPK